MHLSKLTRVLQSFNPPQMKRLSEYVHSPYFKVPKAAVTLFDYLLPLHPVFPERKLNPVVIGKKFNNLSTPAKQGWAGSKLLDAVDGFIAQEDWQHKETEVLFHRLSGLKTMHFFEEFDKVYDKTTEQFAISTQQGVDTFFHKHMFTELSLNGFNAKLKRSEKNDLAPVLRTLDEFYALKKLRYLCEMFERQRVFGTALQKHPVQPLMDILQPFTNPNHPYVYMFVHAFLMLQAETYEESEAPYGIIRDYVGSYTGEHLPAGITESIPFAMNHCLRWYNKGHEKAGAEYLWWIELKMKRGLLLEHGKVMPITFRNIVSIATMSKKRPEWVDQIISSLAPHLPDVHRDTNVAFARGLYHYSSKNYIEAVRYLLLAQAGEEVLFNSNIRRWQFMCLYDCDPTDVNTLYNHLQSFEKYLLRRAKMLVDRKQMLSRFIHYSFELLKSAASGPDKQVVAQLQSEEYFHGKTWLLQQFAGREQKPGVRSRQYEL